MSTIRILLFSALKDTLGRTSLEVELTNPRSTGDLLDDLSAAYPAMRPYRSSIRVAVNESYVDFDHIVQSGDEVALITPVSGG